MVHKIDKIEDYAKFAQGHPGEVKALYQDMLINVTSFFRGPRVFEALKSSVFPAIQKNLSRERGIRDMDPWVRFRRRNLFRGHRTAGIPG